MIEPGTCYAMQTSYGDARPGWLIYWRVRDSIQGFTECHRFETRADGMHVMNPADVVRTQLLESLTLIDCLEWERAWNVWVHTVTEPWLVE
jgi:hypothetical protein